MSLKQRAADAFDDALGMCEGELGLSLFTTWVIVGLSAAFSLLSLVELVALLRKPTIVQAPVLLLVSNLASGGSWVAFNSALLAITVMQPNGASQCSVALGGLNLASACLALSLSVCAHLKSRRPSTLLCSFLFLSLLANVVKCQLLWTTNSGNAQERRISSLFAASTVMELLFLGINSRWQMNWLSWNSDEHSPEETSSIFSLSLYSWLNTLLWKGYHNTLTLDDLYPLDQAISVQASEEKSPQHGHPVSQPSARPSNWDVIMWVVRPLVKPILLPVFPRLCLVGFTFCQPFLINRLLQFLAEEKEDDSDNVSSSLIGATILVYSGIAVSTALYWYYQERAQSILRAFLVSSVYHKAIDAPSSDNKAAITLMSTDVDRIYTGVRWIHEIWANAIQIALSAWHLKREIGVSFLAPLVLVAISFAATFFLSKYATTYQRNWMTYIERRIGITAYALLNIRDYRVSGMTAPVQDIVQEERMEELRQGDKSRGIITLTATLAHVPQAAAPVLTFAFGAHTLDSTKAFTTLSFLSLLTSPLMLVLQVVPIISASFACLRRIYEFTLTESRQDNRILDPYMGHSVATKKSPKASEKTDIIAIDISGGNFGWTAEKAVLRDVNVSLESSSLTFVVGPVASGKSTLIKAILGELPESTGQITIGARLARIGYCDQSPFLMNDTVRGNIVGNSSFDPQKYRDVISATMLDEDLATFPHQDQTKIGSKGVSLSGGQRQRISLARALYHEADLLVLDDIFTGLDANTSQEVCWRVFGPNGLLRSRQTTIILGTQATQFLSVADHVIELEGSVAKQMSANEYISGRAITQYFDLSNEELKEGVRSEGFHKSSTRTKSTALKGIKELKPAVASVNMATKADRYLYRHYFATIGPTLVIVYLVLCLINGFFSNFPAVWLKIWTADSVKETPSHSFAFYMGLFGLLSALGLCDVFPLGILMLQVFVQLSGANLHQHAIQTAMHASLRFLTTTDTGTVLNLFSQDMTIIDSQLPRFFNNFFTTSAALSGEAIVVALSSAYLSISYPVFIAILYGLQKVYLPTSKQLRILDLEAKSPLYTHFLDSLEGLTTLRAFASVPNLIAQHKKLLDNSQRPSYLLAMAQQWLLVVMNVIVAILGTILVSLAVKLPDINSGSVGAGLVMLINMAATMTAVISSYTGLEIALGGINRLKTFSEVTEQEDKPGENYAPAIEWPSSGDIAITGVKASYTGDLDALVLSDLSLDVKSGQKVALCGRTGSGKSSIIALILRMIDPMASPVSKQQSMQIDGKPLDEINRTALRERIIAISQDAVFLPEGSSLLANMDPWNNSSKEEAIEVLKIVGLHDFVAERGGLDTVVKKTDLSAGQRQLLALGRAMLRRRVRARKMEELSLTEGGILLLDEMTASVDKETEKQMMEIVWREFKAYTILMVTHSTEAALHCDRVLILDKGELVEDGAPTALIQQEGSRFGALAGSTTES